MILQSNARSGEARSSHSTRQLAAFAAKAGNPREAERLLREFLAKQPADVPALTMLGEALRDEGRTLEALMLLQRAVAVSPTDGSIRFSLARLLNVQGEAEAALIQIEAIDDPFRSNPAVRALEAALLGRLGMYDREIAIYEELVRDRPDHPALWMSMGNALKYAGRAEESLRALRHSVKVRPTYGEGWWSLANLKTAQFANSDLTAMRKALRGNPEVDDALHLNFALGKALEDRGEYELSFRHYAEGNRIRAAALHPQQMTVTPFVNHVIATFDESLFARMGRQGNPATDPIFIVGLQRSGSTLIEQILASHPMVEGTSELLAMQQLWADLGRSAARDGTTIWEFIRRNGSAQFREIGDNYLARTRPYRRTDRPLFVDKLPANWMMTGLIRLALPNAKIIDARRHPLACGFSNFKQHYATGVAFAYSLESIGQFYVDYLRLMDHFDALQPGAVHHVLNERLINDPEAEVRRLLDYVGLPFDPACMDFHKTNRAVSTPSAEQVRRPINRDGMDYWRHYDPWLGPLKKALGSAPYDWDRLPGA